MEYGNIRDIVEEFTEGFNGIIPEIFELVDKDLSSLVSYGRR